MPRGHKKALQAKKKKNFLGESLDEHDIKELSSQASQILNLKMIQEQKKTMVKKNSIIYHFITSSTSPGERWFKKKTKKTLVKKTLYSLSFPLSVPIKK